jgi:hypothetical protein
VKMELLLWSGELQGIYPIIELVQIALLEWLIGQHLNYIIAKYKQNREGTVSLFFEGVPDVVDG